MRTSQSEAPHERVSQTTITMDREMFLVFKAECIRRGTSPTKVVSELARQQLQAWLAADHAKEA